jgi:hypothetical protein
MGGKSVMTNPALSRAVMLLLKAFPLSNPFWIARLAGCSERAAQTTLAKLEAQGLVCCDASLWSLTPAGLRSLEPQHHSRPRSAIKYRPSSFRRKRA